MKHLFILPAALCLLASCGGNQAGYTITGTIANAGDGKAVLSLTEKLRADPTKFDTVEMTQGRFRFTGQSQQVCIAGISIIPDGQKPASGSLFLENADIAVSADWNSVVEQYGYRNIELLAEGGSNDEMFKSFWALRDQLIARPEYSEYAALCDQMIKLRAENKIDESYALQEQMEPLSDEFNDVLLREQVGMIVANPSMATAAYCLGMIRNNMTLDQLESTFNALDESVRNSPMAAEVRDEIAAMKSVQPGQPAPDFTLNQADGTPLTLSDLRGKVVVIDFWASWCKPCRASNPHMKEFYAKYRDKGVEVLGISNDSRLDDWKKALEEDQLPWLNVVDEFDNPHSTARVITMYAAPYLPTLVLIDRDGKIAAHNIGHDDLEAAVVELL